MTKLYVTTSKVPLIIRFENTQSTVSNKVPKYLYIKFKGTGWKILSLYIKKTEWIIDLDREFQDKKITINTKKSASQYLNSLPDGLIVEDVSPTEFNLKLETVSTKKVPITLNVNLEPAIGYTIDPNYVFEPDSITISGAKSWLDTLSEWPTQKGTISNLNSPFNLTLNLYEPQDILYKMSSNKVNLIGKAEQLAELEFKDIPIQLIQKKGNEEIIFIPNRVNVFIGGGLGKLENLKDEAIKVYIPYTSVKEDTSGSVLPRVVVPSNTQLIKTVPEEVQYIIRK